MFLIILFFYFGEERKKQKFKANCLCVCVLREGVRERVKVFHDTFEPNKNHLVFLAHFFYDPSLFFKNSIQTHYNHVYVDFMQSSISL